RAVPACAGAIARIGVEMKDRRESSPSAQLCLTLGVVISLAMALPASAADSAEPSREFYEMLWMLVKKGADMGPTDGWFHPAQSRYGWGWLKARDKNGDGGISAEELHAPAELFDRLDRDRDGAIKADDLDWSSESTYLRQQAAFRRQFVL